MNWYFFFGTWLAGGIAVAGWMWQRKHEEPKDEFPLQKMRKGLGIPYQEPAQHWTQAWTEGVDKPLKVQPLLPPKQDTGPFEIGPLHWEDFQGRSLLVGEEMTIGSEDILGYAFYDSRASAWHSNTPPICASWDSLEAAKSAIVRELKLRALALHAALVEIEAREGVAR